MKRPLRGNMDLSWGLLRSRAQVIGSHPLMGQISLADELITLWAAAKRDTRFIEERSEYSALAACMGASAAGIRSFTAVSAQSLAAMHELLQRAALGRLPMVVAVVLGWAKRTGQVDPPALRDIGWLQLHCRSGQEALDTLIQAFKVSEQVRLPSMLILNHALFGAAETLDIPDQKRVDRYLPFYRPEGKLDVKAPATFGPPVAHEGFGEHGRQMQLAMTEALQAYRKADQDYRKIFGRGYGLVGQYRCREAKTILVTSVAVAETAEKVVDQLRARGQKVGMVTVRLFRPFPARLVRAALKGAKKVAVIDANISPGSGGILHQEIKAALYSLRPRPKAPIFGFIVEPGESGVAAKSVLQVFEQTKKGGRPEAEIIWVGAKE